MASWPAEWFSRFPALGRDRRLPVLAALLFIVLLAQVLASLTWTLLRTPGEGLSALAGKTVSAPGPSRPQAPPSRQSSLTIGRLHLFGEVQKSAAAPVTPVVEAPDTSLNLKLHGVLASSDPHLARAIVADGRGMEDAYAVDERLPGDAVLKEIFADRIILEYRGRLETLRLPKDESTAGNGASAHGAAQNAGRGGAQSSIANAQTAVLLRQYRDAMVTDPQSVMDLVRAQPVRDKTTGKLKGYRIRPGKDRQLLGRFGLRAGDVVTSINGIPMDNPLKALELMRDISNMTQISVDIERNGKPQNFAFQIE